jgi:hypothetical protein
MVNVMKSNNIKTLEKTASSCKKDPILQRNTGLPCQMKKTTP